ncbi:hypothetical protein [Cytobacillus gottheilii]|uniref:Uncharacterized protein n=1 Tax=Cytobacillus gottheilii TaxID=859144 RepID=A0ABX8FG84_9BACI|nr:hypothetical protein [Cytobacillus gottheilii]QVY63010.1 hypothetical protein J1899_08200 [Cytobacillus gottheilii]
MKSAKFSDILTVVKPEYVYLKLRPNKSIKNNNTHKIAKAIASIHRNIAQNVRKEEAKAVRLLGRDFLVGTRFSYEASAKVSYYIYIEKGRVEFYFIVPKRYMSVLKERATDAWPNITIEQVDELPSFSPDAKYASLSYAKEDALSLATDRRNNDLLQSNLNVVDVLEEGDRVGIFYNFVPTSQFTWRSTYENTLRKVKRGLPTDRNKFGAGYVLKTTIGVLSTLIDDVTSVLSGGEGKRKGGDYNVLEGMLERLNGGNQIGESTRKKATATVLETQIMLMSDSDDKLRRANNLRSLTQSFDAIADDNKLVAKPHSKSFNFTDYRIAGADVSKIGDQEAQNFIALPGRELLEGHDFIEKVETQETQVPDDLRRGVMRIGTSTYRGHEQDAYLSTDREYKQLTLVLIGPTRAGKSTLIGNLANDALNNGECVVMIDFIKNCELSEEVAALFPDDKVMRIECDDFATIQGLGYNEIPYSDDTFTRYVNAKKQTTQLITLVNSINTDDTPLSARMNRYLTSAALTVFISGGSIRDVFGVLQRHELRYKYLAQVPSDQHENMAEYIEYMRELDDCNKEGAVVGTKLHLVEGIISRLNRLKDNAYLEMMLKKDTADNVNLVDELQRNQLICIKMPETMFSTDDERDVYATYWMTKLYLALQVRSERVTDRDQQRKVNLVIDELYQVANTEQLLKQRLSRLAKFGLKPIISCHYLNQIKHIRDELRSANASYMLISGCDKKNYEELKSELYPFTEEDLLRLPRYHSLNLIKSKDGYGRFITRLPAPVDSRTNVLV